LNFKLETSNLRLAARTKQIAVGADVMSVTRDWMGFLSPFASSCVRSSGSRLIQRLCFHINSFLRPTVGPNCDRNRENILVSILIAISIAPVFNFELQTSNFEPAPPRLALNW